ncbi:YARHG domain-containing protein [Tenacibaculum jejuense]|nr:YARHG domain-containing protein [Tenacibaculum jejuense]
MKNTILLYLICSFLLACKKEIKSDKTFDNSNLLTTKNTLSKEVLRGKTSEELRILRNEIFAKKGYVFKDSSLKKYFSNKKWYTPNKDAEIILTDAEKKDIELITSIEKELKPFELPKGYKMLDSIVFDYDNDQILDVIQLVKNIESNYFEQYIFIYLTQTKKLQKIDLGLDDEFDQTYAHINKKDNMFQFEYTLPGTGVFNYEYNFKYNSEIKNFQLCSYVSSSRIMFGHISKEYNLLNGTYEVTKEASTIDNPDIITTKNLGKQESKLITLDLIDGKLSTYLDYIGDEFYEERYSDYDDEFIDCREVIIQKLALDFEYGTNNYLGDYSIFKNQIKNFIQSINSNKLLKSSENSYSKNYTLHRDWDLNYIKEDNCLDELFITFNTKKNSFTIQINNCAHVFEDGKVIHASEQSIIFEYKIERNCTYKYDKTNGAG